MPKKSVQESWDKLKKKSESMPEEVPGNPLKQFPEERMTEEIPGEISGTLKKMNSMN